MQLKSRGISIALLTSLCWGLSGCGDTSSTNFVVTGSEPQPVLVRTLDGTTNHLDDSGVAHSQFLRGTPEAYADGVGSPAGTGRKSAREVSNLVSSQVGQMPDSDGRSDFVWSWGQFIDHDITLTKSGDESLPIEVPAGDVFFDPTNTGSRLISFTRSQAAPGTGTDTTNKRQQINEITAFIDGSMVYGSDEVRGSALRTFQGGMLALSTKGMPPFNLDSLDVDNALHADPTTLFLCGDTRANEHLALTSLHAVFVREHNHWAEYFAQLHPTWTDEQLYQMARKVVGAEIQVITYQEFLPALLGPNPLPDYTGFNEAVDPGIDILFATAGYRLGHTMVGTEFLRLQADGTPIPEGNIQVRNGFFRPDLLMSEGGIEPVLRGLAANRMQSIDPQIVDDLRNFLFGPPGAGGFDLASFNIQRGRDHGLADYNTIRTFFGQSRVTSFAEITTDATRQANLAAAYSSVDEIDAWVGLLSEDPITGTAIGPTLRAILIDQFKRLRDGDRFFYLNDTALTVLMPEIQGTTLSKVIARNTGANLQDNVFFAAP